MSIFLRIFGKINCFSGCSKKVLHTRNFLDGAAPLACDFFSTISLIILIFFVFVRARLRGMRITGEFNFSISLSESECDITRRERCFLRRPVKGRRRDARSLQSREWKWTRSGRHSERGSRVEWLRCDGSFSARKRRKKVKTKKYTKKGKKNEKGEWGSKGEKRGGGTHISVQGLYKLVRTVEEHVKWL